MKAISTLVLLLFTLISMQAQPGQLITSFGTNGVIERQYLANIDNEIQAVIELPDQSIVTVGGVETANVNSLMSRYSKDGMLLWDVEFDASSQNLADFTETAVAGDTCIYTASTFDDQSFPGGQRASVSLRKWRLDGTLDSSFGTGGEVVISDPNIDFLIFDMQIDSLGRFYLIGRTFDFGSNQESGLVIRLNPDGSLDNSYATNGIFTRRWGAARTGFIRGKVILGDLYLVGWNNNTAQTDLNAVFMKVNENGQTVTSFGNGGLVSFTQSDEAEFWSLDQQGPDRIVIAGSFGSGPEDIIVRRYDFDGNLDMTFGTNGTTILDFGDDDDIKSIIVDKDDGIYVGASVGDPEDYGIARLTPDGMLDPTFGNNGLASFDVTEEDNLSEMVLTHDGNIVAGGESDVFNDSQLLIMKIEGVNGCLPRSDKVAFSACDSFIWNGEVFTVSGDYERTIQTIDGCDSTVFLLLTINSSSTQTLIDSACDVYEFNGIAYTTSGSYMQVFTDTAGCDSIIILELTILDSTSDSIGFSSCGDPVVVNGQTYSVSGVYEQSLTNSMGCDSTLTIGVNIQPVATPDINNQNDTLSTSAMADAYQWIDCATNLPIDGATDNAYVPTASGDYAVVVVVGSCTDTSACEQVTLSSTRDIEALGMRLAPNPAIDELNLFNPLSNELIQVTIFNAHGAVVWQQKGVGAQSRIPINISELTAGQYFIQVVDSGGQQGHRSFIKI